MSRINRTIVRKAFSSHADTYDSLAVVQKSVTERFAERLTEFMPKQGAILDIGAGTGRLLESLGKKFPEAELVGLDFAFGMTSCARSRFRGNKRISLACADAEFLPFRSESFNLVVSTSTYQWFDSLDAPFAEVFRVLKAGSWFSFALFGENTLFELRESYQNAITEARTKIPDRTHRFAKKEDVLDRLVSSGFTKPSVKSEIEVEMHNDVRDLVRSLKGIGAGSASGVSTAGLSGRRVMERMIQAYETNFGSIGGIPATYEVIYGKAYKP